MECEEIAQHLWTGDRDRLVALENWFLDNQRRFDKSLKHRHHIYYYKCCHTFCSSQSKAAKSHDQSTKISYKDIVSTNVQKSISMWVASFLYHYENKAKIDRRWHASIRFNKRHYDFAASKRKKCKDLDPRRTKTESLAEEHGLSEKRMPYSYTLSQIDNLRSRANDLSNKLAELEGGCHSNTRDIAELYGGEKQCKAVDYDVLKRFEEMNAETNARITELSKQLAELKNKH